MEVSDYRRTPWQNWTASEPASHRELDSFVWSVVEFNSSGTAMYSDVSIFPSFSVYVNGLYVTTYNQAPVATFMSQNAAYQLAPSQFP